MGALETNTTLIYGVHIRESANDGSDFTNAATDYRVLFLGEDGLLHVKDSAGTVTDAFTAGAASVVPWALCPDGGAINLTNRTIGAANRAVIVGATLQAAATITGVRIVVGTSSGNISVGLYNSSLARVATSGAVACPASGLANVNFTGNYSASAGRFYIGLSCDNNTATFGFNQQVTSGVAGPFDGLFMATAHPLPDPFVSGGSISAPAILARISGGTP